MMNKKSILAIIVILSCVTSLYAQSIGFVSDKKAAYANPVVTIYDGCIEQHKGMYYAMGTGTDGAIYTSTDMIDWIGPYPAVNKNEATWPEPNSEYYRFGAGDILYRNGVWHLYYNGIGHSYAANPLGPYKEHSITAPFDDEGIDAQIFQDKNGDVYYIKKNNSIETHAFRLNSTFERGTQKSNKILSAEKGHAIGSLDWTNFEGPEMFSHHDNYYVSWSPNRMSARTGMYMIGVAQGTSPLGVNNAGKYPLPLIDRTYEDMHFYYDQILQNSEHGEWMAKYTTTAPTENDWMEPTFDASGWKWGKGGFGLKKMDDNKAVIRGCRTIWATSSIWIQRSFNLSSVPKHIAMFYRLEDANASFYFNGNKVDVKAKPDGRGYVLLDIDASYFVEGKNVISVKADRTNSNANSYLFIDFGLFDLKDNPKAEMAVVGPSQSNFIAGPNGFERWMVYKAFWNSYSGQGITRLHFYNDEVVSEGCVTENSPGYHPKPALPTWTAACADSDYSSLDVENNSNASYTNYRFELPFRIRANEQAKAEIYAYYQDADNYIKINILRDAHQWEIEHCENGTLAPVVSKSLPAKFQFLNNNQLVDAYDEPWHTLVVYKNGATFRVELDYFDLTLDAPFVTQFSGEGRVGIVENSSVVSYEKAQLTAGYDEYDAGITGWDGLASLTSADKGMTLSTNDVVSKGDLFEDYEFSAYMSHDAVPTAGESGFYPIYIDANNYVSAMVNYTTQTFDVVEMKNGSKRVISAEPLTSIMKRQYNTMANINAKEQQYDFRTETLVSGAHLMWFEGNYPNWLRQTFGLPQTVELYALQNGTWNKLTRTDNNAISFGKFNHFTFNPVKTKSIKVKLTSPSTSLAVRTFAAAFDEEMAAGYFVRARREGDKLYIWLNNDLKEIVTGIWDASNVALKSNTDASYNGIQSYHIGSAASSETAEREVFYKETFGTNGNVITEYLGNPGKDVRTYNDYDENCVYVPSAPKVTIVNAPTPASSATSGESALMFGAAAANTSVVFGTINTSDYKDIQLSYYHYKPTAPNCEVKIEYSSNGTDWTKAKYVATVQPNNQWNKCVVLDTLPSVEQLRIKMSVSAQFTLFDDIAFSGVKKNPSSVEDASDNASVRIYPNPTADLVTISGKELEQISLYNTMGLLVKNVYGNNQISLAEFSPGIYILQYKVAGNDNFTTSRIVKK